MLERVWRDIFGNTSYPGQKHDIALVEALDRNVATIKEYKAVLYVSGDRMELGLPLFCSRVG